MSRYRRFHPGMAGTVVSNYLLLFEIALLVSRTYLLSILTDLDSKTKDVHRLQSTARNVDFFHISFATLLASVLVSNALFWTGGSVVVLNPGRFILNCELDSIVLLWKRRQRFGVCDLRLTSCWRERRRDKKEDKKKLEKVSSSVKKYHH
jgi:hypothetical protein